MHLKPLALSSTEHSPQNQRVHVTLNHPVFIMRSVPVGTELNVGEQDGHESQETQLNAQNKTVVYAMCRTNQCLETYSA